MLTGDLFFVIGLVGLAALLIILVVTRTSGRRFNPWVVKSVVFATVVCFAVKAVAALGTLWTSAAS